MTAAPLPPDEAYRLDTSAAEHALRRAIAEDRLALAWQPYYSARDGRVVGYEALVRWPRARGGPVMPDAFIPLAEASGLIAELDGWVLARACAQAADWAAPVRVSVNLSASWFGRGDARGLVETALRRSGLPPQRLVLELTEHTLVENFDRARTVIETLRALGVRVALDDFGTGYSSLAYLSTCGFDEIKLDRMFIDSIGRERKAEAICRALIRLGAELGMRICAEGIETPEQLVFLRRHRCDYLQGYLLGRPAEQPSFAAHRLVNTLPSPAQAAVVPRPPSPASLADQSLSR